MDTLEMPRWECESPVDGILNMTAEEIPLSMLPEAKKRLIVLINEVSLIRKKEGVEYASLANVDTGMAIGEHRLIRGAEKEVDISSFVPTLLSSSERSIVLIHKHPDPIPFSTDDLEQFFYYQSIKSLVLAAGERAYFLEKGKGKTSFDDFWKTYNTFEMETVPVNFEQKRQLAESAFAFAAKTHGLKWEVLK